MNFPQAPPAGQRSLSQSICTKWIGTNMFFTGIEMMDPTATFTIRLKFVDLSEISH